MKIEISKRNYKELRQNLKDLNEINQNGFRFQKIVIEDSKGTHERKPKLDDYLEQNSEYIASICDLLNMTDIYIPEYPKQERR